MFYQFENIKYDYLNGIIFKNDQEIKLTNIQKKLLNYLLDHPKAIHSKQKLMEQVWGRVITENSINQFISILRSYVEDNPAEPSVILTHFGKGISFESLIKVEKPQKLVSQTELKSKRMKYIVLAALFLAALALISKSLLTQPIPNKKNLTENQKILILPSIFEDSSTTPVQRKGMESLLALNFNYLESEGQMIFDNSNHNRQQAIEKYWQIDQDIVVMSSNITKKGDIFEVVFELANQTGSVDKKIILANSLSDVLKDKVEYINTIRNDDLSFKSVDFSPNELLIEALGYKKTGNLLKAKQLLKQVLEKQGDFYQARLVLAEMLLREKKLDQSLAQFNTLKSTHANKIIGTEIELGFAKIKYHKNEHRQLINDLTTYQASNLSISDVKKAKIKLQIADAYTTLGETQKAMQSYQDAVLGVNKQLNPGLFAQSYYGQGKALLPKSNEPHVYHLFEQSLTYAKLAGNVEYQILALNSMSKMSISSYEWDKSIALKKQALQLMELSGDKSEVARGLGTLVAILNQSGYFSEAKVVNEKMGKIARDLKSDLSMMHYLHYDAILLMNAFDWDSAQQQIDRQLDLAIKTDNYAMQLDNAFIAFELLLAKKDGIKFKPEWDKRIAIIKQRGFERFQVYMDYYLARYYKLINHDAEAIALLNEVTKEFKHQNDIKLVVDAQNHLAEIYLKENPQKTLEILSQIESYDPHPNPYLEIKAKAFNHLNNHVEALSLLNQAKLNYHESWTAENQALLESIQAVLEP